MFVINFYVFLPNSVRCVRERCGNLTCKKTLLNLSHEFLLQIFITKLAFLFTHFFVLKKVCLSL